MQMVLLGGGLGLTTAPATEAIMGSLSVDKAGVGSAVNDTTRELGGTLGVAIVGSVFASVYSGRLAAQLALAALPVDARAAMDSSMAAAQRVVAQLPAVRVPESATWSIGIPRRDAGRVAGQRRASRWQRLVVAFLLPARARQTAARRNGNRAERTGGGLRMSYTETWSSGHGEVKFFERSDGSRLRYFTGGAGRSLVLMHTVRTQLDYFQRVIPLLWDSFTVYAVDMPGMGWSDIVPGARYQEPDLRAAAVEFITGLDLHDVNAGRRVDGGALALSASV